MQTQEWREVEINGGTVTTDPATMSWRFSLPPLQQGYADAQIDDYGGRRRDNYPWQPGTTLSLRARFSHPAGKLVGTAGFGFWNAPFGPGTGPLPALPQAAWFFYGSAPTELPLAPPGRPGRGWFASTVDAGTLGAISWAPLAPVVILLNQAARWRRRLWPLVQRSLNVSYRELHEDMRRWHHYRLVWGEHGCFFQIDGRPVLQTPFHPRGPLGFVCWIDNQYLVARPTGRFRWGTLAIPEQQWLEVEGLEISEA